MRRASIALLALAATAALVGTVGAGAAREGGRPPLTGVKLQGFFDRALWEGTITFTIAESDPPTILQVDGILPGTCRDKRKGRLVRSGPDGAIGLQFAVNPNARIHGDGSFAFTAKAVNNGLTPHTMTIRGRFYGNNVLGRARGHGGSAKFDPFSNCTGDQPFWAKRIARES